jgi:hypothetical protein
MKKLSVIALLSVFVFLAACTREKDEDMNRDYLGTWKLDKTIEEEYHPINTLSYRDEYIGLPGDSVVIKANGIMYSYEDGDPVAEETEYELTNDSTISIDGEMYKIRKLTDTEFYLHQEEIDQAFDEKWIYQIYLKR